MNEQEVRVGRFYVAIAQSCGIITFGLGLAAIFGWLAGYPQLTSFGADKIPMAPSTALLFLLLGMALVIHTRWDQNSVTKKINLFIGFLILTISLPLFLSASFGYFSKTEHLGFEISGTFYEIPLGHMSPVTAFCFLFAGASFLVLLISTSLPSKRSMTAFWLAAPVFIVGTILTIAYIVGGPLLYGSGIIPPALTTSLSFTMVGMALLMSSGIQVWPYDRRINGSNGRAAYLLLLIFILAATGIVTTGYLYFHNYQKHFHAEVERRLQAISELKVSELVQWRKERMGVAGFFFHNRNFSDRVRNYLDNPNDTEASDRLQTWISKLQESGQYDRIYLLDANTNIRMSIPSSSEPVAAHLAQNVVDVLRTGQVTFVDFHRDIPESPIHLSILVPVYDDRYDTQPLGVLVMDMNPETYLYPFINRWPIPSQTAESLLVRRDNNDVVYLNELRFQKKTALTLRVPLSQIKNPAVKAALGQKGIMEGIDYRGVPVIADVRPIPDSPWFLIARIDTAEVNEPLKDRLWNVVGLIGALILGAGVGIGLLWRDQRNRFYREQYKAAEALRISEARLRAIIDNAKGIIWVKDLEGRFLIVNRYLETLMGLPQEQIIGRTVYDLFPPDLAEEYTRNDRQVLDSGETSVLEESARLHEERQTYLSIKFPMHDSNGKTFALGAICTDITPIKNTERQIRKLNRIYAVLSDTNQAIVRIREPQALFEKACRIAVEKGGLRLAWIGLLDDSTPTIRPVASSGASPDALDGMLIPMQEDFCEKCPIVLSVREGRNAVCNAIRQIQHPCFCKTLSHELGFQSAASFPLRVFGQLRGNINFFADEIGFFDEDELRLLDELAMDISFSMEFAEKENERLRMEEALRQKDADLSLALEASRMGNWSWNIQTGEVIWSDQCKALYGMSADTPVNYEKFLSVIHQDDRERVDLLLRQSLENRTDYEVEKRIVWPDGSIHWNASRGRYYYNESGEPTCVIGVTIDITERKRAELEQERLRKESERLKEQLFQVQKMEAVGRLAGGVAHDFNNIIMAVLGYSDLALINLPQDSPVRNDMEEIKSAANRAALLTRQLLAFSRKQTISPKVLDLNDAVTGMLNMLQRLIGEDIDLAWIPGKNLRHIKMDPSQIDQILANLVVNSRDAIDGVGKITIETSNMDFDESYCRDHVEFKPGSYVRLTVSDNGCGMDKDTQDKIFEPFFTTKGLGKGTGLGLSTVYGIVKQNEGFINVYSELGIGTSIRIYYSSVADDALLDDLDSTVETVNSGTETVLIVEDDSKILKLGFRLLKNLGYNVLSANSPAEAIRFVENYSGAIHLLITDVVMPEMNGREMAEKLLILKPDLKILYMSGYTANVIAHRGVLEEGVHFIQKPFSMDTLARKIRETLENSSV